MKVKRVYLKLLALLPIPFLLTGCTNEIDCNIPNDHVHKYIGSNNRGTVETYLNSEYEQHESRGSTPAFFPAMMKARSQERQKAQCYTPRAPCLCLSDAARTAVWSSEGRRLLLRAATDSGRFSFAWP